MDKFGIIGNPLGHSKSPAAFTAAYDGRWQFDLIEGPDFELLWQKFLKEYKAANVTAPYKEMAFRKADILTPEVEKICATNLVINSPEGVKAYNSDYRGVKQVMINAGMKPGNTALVVGSGGAGKAAAFAAKDLGMKTFVSNRTEEKAIATASHIGIEVHPFYEPMDVDFLVYTIPETIEDITRFRGKIVLEAAYATRAFTPEILKSIGAEYISGKEWHFQQAIAGYGLMTGVLPNIEATRKVYDF